MTSFRRSWAYVLPNTRMPGFTSDGLRRFVMVNGLDLLALLPVTDLWCANHAVAHFFFVARNFLVCITRRVSQGS